MTAAAGLLVLLLFGTAALRVAVRVAVGINIGHRHVVRPSYGC